MSTVIDHQAVDVVVVGLGQMGGVISAELSLKGYKVVGIDKGPYLDYATDFAETRKFDEWKTQFTHFFDHKLSMWTYSIRTEPTQFALPVRRYTKGVSNVPEGHEVGGMGVHFSGGLGRYMPWTYSAYSSTNSRYGTSFLGDIEPNTDLEDYPVSYDDLVPYYQSWEKAIGVSGDNQEPFIPNSTYPNPPHPFTPLATMWQAAVESMGYNPNAAVSAIASKPYVNQYGVTRNECVYDGWCASGSCNFVCETGAKGSSHVSTIPAAIASGNFTMVTNCVVTRINLNSAGTQATGVTYIDQMGNINVQPATVVFVGMWSLPSIRMLLLSGVGTPYNTTTVSGTVGRGLQPPPTTTSSSTSGTITTIGGNAYPCGNASGGGYAILDFAGDNFDHTGLNFIGGAQQSAGSYLGGSTNTLTLVSPGLNNFGSTYKASLKNVKLPKSVSVSVGGAGVIIPTTDHFADLDPHYIDMFGDPILRLCMNFDANTLNCSDYLAKECAPILTKLGATNIKTTSTAHGSIAPFQRWSAHQRGGARMGASSSTSVYNQWLQNWSVENVFSAGEHVIMLGDCVTPGTHGIAPMSYLAAEGIEQYLTSPGELVTSI